MPSKRSRSAFAIVGAVCALVVGGCAKPAPAYLWGKTFVMREAGGANLVAAEAAPERAEAQFHARHYAQLSVDRLFLRGIPAQTAKGSALVGFRVHGVLPSGKPLYAGAELVEFDGDGAVEVLLPMQVKAFAYRGPVELELWVAALEPEAVEFFQGRLAGAGGIRSPRPFDATTLERSQRTLENFEQSAGTKRWTARVALHEPPTGSEAPALLAGRTLLVFEPPTTAPAAMLNTVSPQAFAANLTMRGDGPVWKADGREYRETPHLLVRLERQRRLGWREHPAYEAMRNADALLKDVARGKADAFERGKTAVAAALAAIREPDVFVEEERKLVTELVSVRRLRLSMTEAERKGDQATRLADAQKLVDVLALLLTPERETLVTEGERREFEGEQQHLLREIERAKR